MADVSFGYATVVHLISPGSCALVLGTLACFVLVVKGRVVRSLLATWNSHSITHDNGSGKLQDTIDEECAVPVTAASSNKQVRRVVPPCWQHGAKQDVWFTSLAPWSSKSRCARTGKFYHACLRAQNGGAHAQANFIMPGQIVRSDVWS